MDLPQDWNILHILAVLIGHHLLGHSRSRSAALLRTDQTTIAHCLRPLTDSGLEHHQFGSIRFELKGRHYRTVPRLQWFDLHDLLSRHATTVPAPTEALLRVMRAYAIEPVLAAKLVHLELENPMPLTPHEWSPRERQVSQRQIAELPECDTIDRPEQCVSGTETATNRLSSSMTGANESELTELDSNLAREMSYESLEGRADGQARTSSDSRRNASKCLRCRDMSTKCSKDSAGCDRCEEAQVACRYPAVKHWEYMEDTATTKADLAIDTLQVLERFMTKNRHATANENDCALPQDSFDTTRNVVSKTRATTSQTTFHQYLKVDDTLMKTAEAETYVQKCPYCSQSEFRTVHARKYHILYRCPNNPSAEKNYKDRRTSRRVDRLKKPATTSAKICGNPEDGITGNMSFNKDTSAKITCSTSTEEIIRQRTVATTLSKMPLTSAVPTTDSEMTDMSIALDMDSFRTTLEVPKLDEELYVGRHYREPEFKQISICPELEQLARIRLLEELLSRFDKSTKLIDNATWRVLPLLVKIDGQNRFRSMKHFLHRRCGMDKDDHATLLGLIFEYIFRTSTTIEAVSVLKMVGVGLTKSEHYVDLLDFLMSQSDTEEWSKLVELFLFLEIRW